MIKIFTSRFKSMFPWLLVMPWCRSKILDQSLSHACLVGTGHNKGKEKKKTFSLGNEKKILEENLFYSRWEYCSIIFHTRNFATIKVKLIFFILKILLFVLVRYKNLMKRAKKSIPRAVAMQKKCFPLNIVEWFDCAFVNLDARAYVRLVSEPLYFSAFMSAKDKTQYKLIARPK